LENTSISITNHVLDVKKTIIQYERYLSLNQQFLQPLKDAGFAAHPTPSSSTTLLQSSPRLPHGLNIRLKGTLIRKQTLWCLTIFLFGHIHICDLSGQLFKKIYLVMAHTYYFTIKTITTKELKYFGEMCVGDKTPIIHL